MQITIEQLHVWADSAMDSGKVRLANALQLAALELAEMPDELCCGAVVDYLAAVSK
jgi:propanediol dehydratase small subunit